MTTAGLASWEPVADSGGGGGGSSSLPVYSNYTEVSLVGTNSNAALNDQVIITHPNPGTEMRFLIHWQGVSNGSAPWRPWIGSDTTSNIVSASITGNYDPTDIPNDGINREFIGSWNSAENRFEIYTPNRAIALADNARTDWAPGSQLQFGGIFGANTIPRANAWMKLDIILTGNFYGGQSLNSVSGFSGVGGRLYWQTVT